MSLFRRLFGKREKGTATSRFALDVERRGDNFRVRTTGLRAEGARELEIVEIPAQLRTAAEEVILLLAERVAAEKPIADGASVGGPLLDSTQPVIHIATLRTVSSSIEPGAEELFRVVDFGSPVEAKAPARLLATHLALRAAAAETAREREVMARQSIALFNGVHATTDGRTEFDRGENLSNFLGWEALGDALIDQGSVEEGVAALREAAARCPAWAKDFSEHVRASVSGSDAARDRRLQFWFDYRP